MSAAVAHRRTSPHIPRPASRTHSPMDNKKHTAKPEGELVVASSPLALLLHRQSRRSWAMALLLVQSPQPYPDIIVAYQSVPSLMLQRYRQSEEGIGITVQSDGREVTATAIRYAESSPPNLSPSSSPSLTSARIYVHPQTTSGQHRHHRHEGCHQCGDCATTCSTTATSATTAERYRHPGLLLVAPQQQSLLTRTQSVRAVFW